MPKVLKILSQFTIIIKLISLEAKIPVPQATTHLFPASQRTGIWGDWCRNMRTMQIMKVTLCVYIWAYFWLFLQIRRLTALLIIWSLWQVKNSSLNSGTCPHPTHTHTHTMYEYNKLSENYIIDSNHIYELAWRFLRQKPVQKGIKN